MKIINKCGEKYCGHSRHQTQVEECRAAAPEGWSGLCPFQEYVRLKDFSVPNPKEGTMLTKEEFRQHLVELGCSRVAWCIGDVWCKDKGASFHIPLDAAALVNHAYAPEIRQCANDMVDLEAFTEYLAEKDKKWREDTHCPHCGEYLPIDYHRGYDI